MSVFVTTDLGRFRRADGAPVGWLFECPCGEWLPLTLDMMEGRTSVNHASQGCSAGYHETHRYDIELVARMQTRILSAESPVDPYEESDDEGPMCLGPEGDCWDTHVPPCPLASPPTESAS